MRNWCASLTVLGLATAAVSAQTVPVPPVGGCGQSQSLLFDDGGAETSWKVFNPTGAGDAFNVDFDGSAGGLTLTCIAMNTWQTTSTGPIGIKYVALAGDSGIDTTGHTPDMTAPLSILGSLTGTVVITGNPGVGSGFCPGMVGYDIPDVILPCAGAGVHAVTTCLTGDSGTWLCSDASAPDGHSFYSTDTYATPATNAGLQGHDLMMRICGTVPCLAAGGGSAYLTVNNSPCEVSIMQTGLATATLWSCCPIQPTLYIQGVLIPGYPFLQVPDVVLSTGYENGSTISDPFQGTVCDALSDPSTGPCVPAGLVFEVIAFYLDNGDLKKNGQPKIHATNTVKTTVTPNLKYCNPCFCLGQLDDGSLDATLWKVQNPAGSGDYFNVGIGDISPGGPGSWWASQIKSIQIVSWDFCGSGPSWGAIGLYNGTTADPYTPDLTSPMVNCTSLSMAPNASDFNYPGTTYDCPDIFCSTFTGNDTAVNIVACWPPGDTCIWMGSDSDGTDDVGTPRETCSCIPTTASYFTNNSYSTPAIQFTIANWMMRIEWC